MKKIYAVMQGKNAAQELEVLRDLGVLHVEHINAPKSAALNEIKKDVELIEETLSVLSAGETDLKQQQPDDWKEKAEEILGFTQIIDKYQANNARHQAKLEYWTAWGDFNVEDIQSLKEKGVYFRFFEIPEKELSNVPEDVVCYPVFVHQKKAGCVVISENDVELPYKRIPTPAKGIFELRKVIARDQERIGDAHLKIKEAAQYRKYYEDLLLKMTNELAFQEVLDGKAEDDELCFIKGFIPKKHCDQFVAKAQERQWAVLVQDPDPEDTVPTLLDNPKWVELIKPVFDVINVLPGYQELDISMLFLIFFSLFFGILIGDAGYGAVFLTMTAVGHWKMKNNSAAKPGLYLMYVLSSCTILWGLLTGTYFGQQWIPDGVLKPLVPWLSSLDNVQALCFFIGALHLSLAHAWRGLLKFPSLSFLAEAGWISMLWGMFFLAKTLVLGQPFAALGKYLFMVGPALVLFFTKPQKNPLKSIGAGLGELALNAVNTFTDIVSYIRLFAVGLATVAVADAFNSMALGIGFDNVVAGFFTALILVLGHLFNIVLGAMSILVHGLRLNVLEFSGHLNLEWAGFRYSPFQKIKKK